jgi:hypothetical protein
MTNCWDCDPGLLVYVITVAVLCFAPVGAFVMRHHIARATGIWRVAGRALQVFGAISAPFAVLVLWRA